MTKPAFTTGLVGLLLAVLAVSAAATSPWTREPGHGYAQVAVYTILPYDRLVVNGTEEYRVGRELQDTTVEAYLEHGLAEGWTATAVVPWRWLEAGDVVDDPAFPLTIEEGSKAGLGNVRVGVRRRLARGAWSVAAGLDVEMPTADFDAATGLRTGIDAWSVVPGLAVGRGSARSYGSLHAGVALRSDGYSEQWRAGFEYGRRPFDRWWFVAGIEVVQSLRNGDRVPVPTNLETGLYLDEQGVVAPVLKTLYEIDPRWGVMATVQGGFAGDFVARSPFLGAAVFARY